jgi:TolB-like protein/DNA-binding winged helix-turn-helix (wHTH) protein/Flp pilus assembly protein TadD
MRDEPESNESKHPREAAPLLRFAGLVIDLDACRLARESGEAIPLTDGEFVVLRMFVTRPGRVISRDTLLDAFANRRFEPFDRSVDVLIGKLRRKIEADPKQPRLIVTVPGEGYRFDGLMKTLDRKPSIAVPPSSDRESGDPESEPSFAEGPAAFGAAGGAKAPLSEPREPPRLSIVALPFANIGSDASQDYFVDGVTDSLTTDLSRIGGAFVISRSTAFTYKGRASDVRQIGRELNVRYVLEGSVQRVENRARVNVQLIEAESGRHLWAERFDKPVGDLLEMEDEIVSRLANALNAQLVAAEARRAARAPAPDSIDLYFQGMAEANKGPTPEAMARAGQFFDRALSLDPSNVDALAGRAFVETVLATALMDNTRVAGAEAMLIRLLSRAPDHAWAHQMLGVLQIHHHRVAQGIGELEQALALDRNLAGAHGFIGLAKIFSGRSEETEAHVREALRLSPRDIFAHIWIAFSGVAKLYLDEDQEAVARLRRATGINTNFSIAHFMLAAALARLARLKEARAAVEAGLAVDPLFTVIRFRTTTQSDNRIYLAQHQRVCDSMSKGGVPEG